MNYRNTLEYMESLQQYGMVLGLQNMICLCEKLGNPQKHLKFIHIAGTNGKGSVLAFISTVLKESGYKTGRYISPVIFEYRERIQVNGRMISQKDLCSYVERVKIACEEMVAGGLAHPTPFEIETALAFLYFREKKCDIVVLETGLGGSADATNIIENTLIAVFTSISMDHMSMLGDTLSEIATAKSGIIKKGCRVVSCMQQPEVMKVLEEVCKAQSTPLTIADATDARKIKSGINKQSFSYKHHEKCEIMMAGNYQIANAVLALEVLDILQETGIEIKKQTILKGIRDTVWEGRFSVVSKRPLFIADGAHNEDAAIKLAETIQFHFTNKKILYIIGMLKDKEYERVIAHTYSLADSIITVKPPNEARAMDAYELAKCVMEYHSRVTAADSLEEAVEISHLMADQDTVIIAFGSLSFMGKIIQIVRKREKNKKVVI